MDLNNITNDGREESVIAEFVEHMNDDFNTPNVYTLILQLIKDINVLVRSKNYETLAIKFNTLVEILEVFGISFEYHKLTEDERAVYDLWQEARNNKDFEKADVYRNELVNRGVLWFCTMVNR